MNVLLATGSNQIENYIKENRPDMVFDSVAFRRYIIPKNKENYYDLIIVSSVLSGKEDMREIIFETQRESNCRIIYFVGNAKPAEVVDVFMLGVRDFILDPIDPRKVLKLLSEPATYGMAAEVIKQLPTQQNNLIKQIGLLMYKNSPEPELELTDGGKAIIKGLMKFLRQKPSDTYEDMLLKLQDIVTQMAIGKNMYN